MKLSDYLHLGLTVCVDAEFDSACKAGDTPQKGRYLLFIEDGKIDATFFSHIDRVTAVITTGELADKFAQAGFGVAYCDCPKAAFIKICNTFQPKWCNKPTLIGSNCTISPNVPIPKYGVVIGNNVVIEDGVRIYSGTTIGNDCYVGYGTLLGCENYERCRDRDGSYIKAEHKGGLVIGNGVTIGEYSLLDKALFDWDNTLVGNDCFIGRECDIAHGSKVGEGTTLAPRVHICGNVIVGSGVKLAVASIISNRITIGDGAIVSIGSVVNKNVAPHTRVTGNLAIPHDKFLAHIKKITSD